MEFVRSSPPVSRRHVFKSSSLGESGMSYYLSLASQVVTLSITPILYI